MTQTSDMPDLAVIIVSWNTCDVLRDCLRSVFSGALGNLKADVWVVDNASTDQSAAMVRAQFPDVHLMENRENVGFARANNQVLQTAKARYFLLLNSDTVATPNVLARLVREMETRPDVAVASPLLLNADATQTPQFCWAKFPGFWSEITGKLDLRQSPYPLTDYKNHDARPNMAPFAVDWVGGACFCVRAEAMQKVGLLDEGFFMYGEETQWCKRFQSAGFQTLMVPALAVTHLGGKSSRIVPRETRRRMFVSAVRLFRFLYGPFSLPAVCAAALRYAAFRIKYRGKP